MLRRSYETNRSSTLTTKLLPSLNVERSEVFPASQELSSLNPPLAAPEKSTESSSRMHRLTIQLRNPRISQFCYSFIPQVSRLWNQLSVDVFPSSQISCCSSLISTDPSNSLLIFVVYLIITKRKKSNTKHPR